MADSNKGSDSDSTQDGFDAIEYPLDFSFKAVCETINDLSIEELQATVRQAVVSVIGESETKDQTSKESSAGKYVSVTTIARLQNRQQLESVYTAISQLNIVKMTL